MDGSSGAASRDFLFKHHAELAADVTEFLD